MTKIISIHSYRGGTGKSNITANLVTSIALQGKQVVVIDCDIQSPGIHNIFDLNESDIDKTLNDYFWGRATIYETIYDVSQETGIKNEGKILLIPASVNADEIARILSEGYNVNLIHQGIQELIKNLNLDYVFIDTHPGLSKEVFLSIAISHIFLVVLRPDRQDFQGTAIIIDLAKQLMIPKMMLLVNKVVNSINFNDLKIQIENTYGIPIVGMFPVSEEMFLLGSNGIFCQEYAYHNWTKNLRIVAEEILKA
ncbi:MinD/ParA family protein [Geminocystis sp. GBBB08]|uniref:MinD/ParA family ATP-binding protein n=1 Tax=Geminocystis sp. GBBB08 TaxID=2604140 RepID=UPI0027E39405|nr:MinD/ParA family protein [Geminocystis sp. GBBB08]MBL1211388.1 MinD/ParA family protein [Geminocystis sp. GBBB08]